MPLDLHHHWKIITALLCLIGCAPEPDTPLATPKTAEVGRIQITRIGVFADDLAYNSRRGIYLIKDTVSGKQYVGISGIGISELGDHSVGKQNTSDER